MAITVTNTTLQDGKKLAVIQCTGVFATTTGEETDAVKVDVSTLTPVPTTVKIQRIWYNNTVPGTFLEFDGATDGLAVVFDDSGEGYLDYRAFGGLQDNSTTPTGDITLTTLGTAAAGNGYNFVIEIWKN